MSKATQPSPYLSARIIHGALLGGQVLFLAIVLVIIKDSLVFSPADGDYMLPILCGVIAIPALFIAPLIEKSIYKGKNDSEITPRERTTGSLIKYALWEGPCLLSLIVMLVTKSLVTLPFVIIIFALFFSSAPQEEHYSVS